MSILNLPTMLPNGDSAVHTWTTQSGGTTNLYQSIDEGIAAANDADYVKGPNATFDQYFVLMSDTPADFVSMLTLTATIRWRLLNTPPGTSPDTFGIFLKAESTSGFTWLAANDPSGGTWFIVPNSTNLSTAWTNTTGTWPWIDTTATKTKWDACRVYLSQQYAVSGTADTNHIEISAFEMGGTYVSSLSGIANWEEMARPQMIRTSILPLASTLTLEGETHHVSRTQIRTNRPAHECWFDHAGIVHRYRDVPTQNQLHYAGSAQRDARRQRR